MDDTSKSVMVALLPISADWCTQDLPHLTVVYAGKVKDLSPTLFNELGKAASSIAMMSKPIVLQTAGVEVFGDLGEKVDVIRLHPSPELLAIRNFFEKYNASEFPFNPHVTVGSVGSMVGTMPNAIGFNRISVNWGDEALNFWLKTNY